MNIFVSVLQFRNVRLPTKFLSSKLQTSLPQDVHFDLRAQLSFKQATLNIEQPDAVLESEKQTLKNDNLYFDEDFVWDIQLNSDQEYISSGDDRVSKQRLRTFLDLNAAQIGVTLNASTQHNSIEYGSIYLKVQDFEEQDIAEAWIPLQINNAVLQDCFEKIGHLPEVLIQFGFENSLVEETLDHGDVGETIQAQVEESVAEQEFAVDDFVSKLETERLEIDQPNHDRSLKSIFNDLNEENITNMDFTEHKYTFDSPLSAKTRLINEKYRKLLVLHSDSQALNLKAKLQQLASSESRLLKLLDQIIHDDERVEHLYSQIGIQRKQLIIKHEQQQRKFETEQSRLRDQWENANSQQLSQLRSAEMQSQKLKVKRDKLESTTQQREEQLNQLRLQFMQHHSSAVELKLRNDLQHLLKRINDTRSDVDTLRHSIKNVRVLQSKRQCVLRDITTRLNNRN
ncbi:hypothetical protein MIR68_004942 [Amoeboaphelidium protococcarum]|nr:hypothetical protein MIR68_004942 [Amoeboaphelidium protococcarum]